MNSTELLVLAGTTASVIANVILAYLLQRRSLAMAEYQILEKTCERQRGEIHDLHRETGRLKEQTDLAPLMSALIKQGELIKEWRDEGRARFTAATEQLVANTEAVKALTRAITQQLKNP